MSELWPGGPEYAFAGAFPVTTDSVLLADFARVRPGSRVLELCCGAGLISLLLMARAPGLDVLAVELDEAAAALARENFAANGMAARVMCGDLRDAAVLPEANSVYFVVCNPQYFAANSGKAAPDRPRAVARSESECTLADVARAAARSLRQGGRLALVHRSERLAEVLAALAAERLEPKRLRFVQHRPGSAPGLFLCEAVRLGRPGLTVEAPLVLYGEDGRESDEFRRIYHLGG